MESLDKADSGNSAVIRRMPFVSSSAWCLLAVLALTNVLALWSCRNDIDTVAFLSRAKTPCPKPLKIVFGGDTAFAESYGEQQIRLLDEKGYDFPIAGMKPMLDIADLVVCNLETPITNLSKSPYEGRKTYVHRSHVVNAPKAYKANNMLAFSLANNHTLDYGFEGLVQTIDILKQNSISYFGAGLDQKDAEKPLVRVFRVGGLSFKLAVIGAFQYSLRYDFIYNFYANEENGGCNTLEVEAVRRQIAALRAKDSDIFVVVYPHWGKNYKWRTWRQSIMGRAMIRAGADLVIGHGAHGMQEIERYQGKWILYGLGNFVFLTEGRYTKKKFPPYSYTAMLVVCDNRGNFEPWVRLYPILSNNLETQFQPRPLTDKAFDRFCRLLKKNSSLPETDELAISKGKDSLGNYLQFRAAESE